MLIDLGHDDGALALVGEFDVALDFLDDFDHVDLLGGDDVADVGVDDGVLLEDLHVLEVDGLLLLVARVLVQVLEAEVLPVVGDIVVLADDHPLAGLELGNADLVVVEHALLVLLQLVQELGIACRNLLYVGRVEALHPRRSALSVYVVEVVEEGDVLEGLVYRTLELREDAFVDRALQLVAERVCLWVLVLVEEEDELRGQEFMSLKDDAFPANGEELIQIFDGELLGHESAAELHIIEGDMH